MPDNKRLLIFSVSVGTGHTRAAEAIKLAVLDKYPGSEVKITDTFNDTCPWLGKVIFGSYLFMIRKVPFMYRELYNRADEGRRFSIFSQGKFNRIIKRFTRQRLMDMIADFEPNAIICTHPFAMGIASELKAGGYLKKPLVGIITDFIIHPYWLYHNVDKYFVASREQKDGLIAKGIPAEGIVVSGIPIHPNFSLQLHKATIKKSLGLKAEIPLVMIMGGGLGIGPLAKIVRRMAKDNISAQFIVVVGKNQKLHHKIEEIGRKKAMPMKIFGFVHNVHELMDVADVFITKPGGLTVAEALSKGLPMVLTKSIPGHEERNADFLVKSGVAVAAGNEIKVSEVVNRLLQNPSLLQKMSKKAVNIGNPQAADQIASVLMDL